MLGKLLKHEFLYYARYFTPYYIAYFVLCVITRVFFEFSKHKEFSASVSFSLIYVVLILVFTFGGFILLFYGAFSSITRFKNNIFGNEGYLTNTLPIKSHNHIIAKLLSGIVLYIVSVIVVGISTFVIGDFDLMGMSDLFAEMFDSSNFFGAFSSLISSSVSYITFILLAYMCTALTKNNGLTLLLTIGLIILYSIVILFGFLLLNRHFDDFETINYFYTGFNLLICVGLFFTTNYLIKNKLNLQ